MSDLALNATDDGGEVSLNERGDFILDNGLFTAVYISLFSSPFWGNSILAKGHRTESEFMELFKNPIVSSTRNKAIRIAEKALSWLVSFGIAQEVIIDAEIKSVSELRILVKVIQPDENIESYSFGLNWEGQKVKLL